MSKKYPGGFVTAFSAYNPAPTSVISPAVGVWTLDQAMGYQQQNAWPTTNFGFTGRAAYSSTFGVSGVSLSPTGDIYTSSYYLDTGVSEYRGALIKFNSSGALQWVRDVRPTSPSTARAIFRGVGASSNNVFVSGDSGDPSTNYAMTLIKYDNSGTLLWERTLAFSSTSRSFGGGIALDSSENSYIVGQAVGPYSSTIFSAVLAKYDTSGNIVFQRDCGGGSFATNFNSVAVASSGNIYCNGYAEQAGAVYRPLIVKYNSAGTIQWQRQITNINTVSSSKGALDSNENFYVGYSSTIIKYNASGVIQWSVNLSSNNTVVIYAVNVSTDNFIYVIGSVASNGLFFAKLDSSGQLVFARQFYYGSVGSETGLFSDIQTVGNYLFVAGQSSNASSLVLSKFIVNGQGTNSYSVGGQTATYASISASTSNASTTDAATTYSDRAAGLTSSTRTLGATTTAPTSYVTNMTG